MFEPYIIEHGIGDLKFLVVNEQGQDWYDPLRPYTRLEYKWVHENLPLHGAIVIDAGCHHGNYSVLFDDCERLLCVDAHLSNCAITQANLCLNYNNGDVVNCAVTDHDGSALFNGQTNGRIGSGSPVECHKLVTLERHATIVKLDVEGAEFSILPGAIDEMEHVKAWIVEVHPTDGDAHKLTMEFVKRGWDVVKVDRDIMAVVSYEQSCGWYSHATIIARRS